MRAVGLAMAKWTLECHNCWASFQYLPIRQWRFADYFLPVQPDFPSGGSDIKCPRCGHIAKYERMDLIYENSESVLSEVTAS
jgi:DNA-directed RNA polymerase subunit RPC12/RpoP